MSNASIATSVPVKMASCSAIVIRCGCSDAQKSAPGWHGARGALCPNPRTLEDRGTVAYWHRNPLRRAAWRVSRWFRGEF